MRCFSRLILHSVCLQSYVSVKDVFKKSGELTLLCSDTEEDIDKEIKENKNFLEKLKVLKHLEDAKELIRECYPPTLIKKAI